MKFIDRPPFNRRPQRLHPFVAEWHRLAREMPNPSGIEVDMHDLTTAVESARIAECRLSESHRLEYAELLEERLTTLLEHLMRFSVERRLNIARLLIERLAEFDPSEEDQ